MNRVKSCRSVLVAVSASTLGWALLSPLQAFGDSFKLGAEEKQYIESGGYQYPAPTLVPQAATPAAAPPSRPLQGGANQTNLQGGAQDQERPAFNLQARHPAALPPGYLGTWHVSGMRQKVEASPEFQNDAERAFQGATNDFWTISGNPSSGYSMSNPQQGMSTQLWVDKVLQNGTAFIRYQHPIRNTMAQEAIVLSLAPGGAQFQGLERISIVKQGQPPRAKVTYQLMGQRQR